MANGDIFHFISLLVRAYDEISQLLIVNKSKNNSVNNKKHKYDWMLTTLIYGLIICIKSQLSYLTYEITNICTWAGQI